MESCRSPQAGDSACEWRAFWTSVGVWHGVKRHLHAAVEQAASGGVGNGGRLNNDDDDDGIPCITEDDQEDGDVRVVGLRAVVVPPAPLGHGTGDEADLPITHAQDRPAQADELRVLLDEDAAWLWGNPFGAQS